MNVDSTVVGNVAKLAEIVHKLADARASGPDHICKFLLSDWRYHALGFSRLAELSHDEQCAGETLFAVVEQLVDKVLSSSDPPKQDELQENVRELMLFVQKQNHLLAA